MLPLATLQSDVPRLHRLFSDHCVLQRGRPIPVFGFAPAGRRVRVALDRTARDLTAGPDGTFRGVFPALRAGTGHTLSLDGRVVARDVAVGEVWIASGQSNMEWPQAEADDYETAKREARADVRSLNVTRRATGDPLREVDTAWVVATPDSVGTFSAVGNAFAKELARELKVPVGILNSSYGGTPAEAWLSEQALLSRPELASFVTNFQAGLKDYPAAKAAYDKLYAEYTKGREGLAEPGPEAVPTVPGPWREVTLPNSVEVIEGKAVDGAFQFKRTVTLTDAQAAGAATLRLGAIDDYDTVYVNGRKVASTGREQPEWWQRLRVYPLPGGTFRAGENEIVVRMVDDAQGGGFTSPAGELRLETVAGQVALAGPWTYAPERIVAGEAPPQPYGPENPYSPGGLYRGMIEPLRGYGVRGAIWYQGESNVGRAPQYRILMTSLIEDWRRTFARPDLGFFIVSLANFQARRDEPGDSAWAELRDAQRYVAETVPGAGLAAAIDIGDADDIHPRNKREVGRRLALQALAKTYGRKGLVFEGPVPKVAKRTAEGVEIAFDTPARTLDGTAPLGFAVRTSKGWAWARALVRDGKVALTSPDGGAIEAVRYGWGDNPAVSLVGPTGLPAHPFELAVPKV